MQKAKQDIVAHLIDHRLSPLTIAESISSEFGEPLFDLAVLRCWIITSRIEPTINSYKASCCSILTQRGQILYVANQQSNQY